MLFRKFVFLEYEEKPIPKVLMRKVFFPFLLAWPQVNKVSVNAFIWYVGLGFVC